MVSAGYIFAPESRYKYRPNPLHHKNNKNKRTKFQKTIKNNTACYDILASGIRLSKAECLPFKFASINPAHEGDTLPKYWSSIILKIKYVCSQ